MHWLLYEAVNKVLVLVGLFPSLASNFTVLQFAELSWASNNNGFICIAARMLDYTISAAQDSAYNRTQIIIWT